MCTYTYKKSIKISSPTPNPSTQEAECCVLEASLVYKS